MTIMKYTVGALMMPVFSIFLASASFAQASGQGDIFAQRRQEMVDRQIRQRGVTDKRVLAAMLKVERHLFVPVELSDMAYEDTPLPIRFDQTVSQPYIVAFMTDALGLEPTDRVLEIGTGSGYQAAILAELVKEVYTIEIVKELAESSEERLKKLGYANIHVRLGDGYKGWPEEAPFDAIIATAAPLEIPETLLKQLKTGGRMIIPVGSIFQQLFLVTKTEKGYDKKALLPVKFVPMVTPYDKDRSKDPKSDQGGIFR
jgi:protein-L-isoaspartate(D-aspartate) O-methyltransferase